MWCGERNGALGVSCHPCTDRACGRAGPREEANRARSHVQAAETETAPGQPSKPEIQVHMLWPRTLSALGLNVSSSTLTEWLVLIPVLALEIGSALAVVLVQSVSGALNASKSTRSNASPETVRGELEKPSVRDGVHGVHGEPVKSSVVADYRRQRLVSMLKERGGTVFVGQRSFAKALGISAAGVNKVLTRWRRLVAWSLRREGGAGTVVRGGVFLSRPARALAHCGHISYLKPSISIRATTKATIQTGLMVKDDMHEIRASLTR